MKYMLGERSSKRERVAGAATAKPCPLPVLLQIDMPGCSSTQAATGAIDVQVW